MKPLEKHQQEQLVEAMGELTPADTLGMAASAAAMVICKIRESTRPQDIAYRECCQRFVDEVRAILFRHKKESPGDHLH